MKYYPENLIQSTLSAHGASCTVEPAVLGYTCTTYTAHLDGGITPQTLKNAVGALEIATGQKIIYNANTGVGNTLKITIPNPERAFPSFFAFGRNAYGKQAGEMLIGVDTDNQPVTANLTDTLSILVAGATGSGKSVAVNNLVLSLAIGAKPTEIVFLMIDLKRTEFSNPLLIHSTKRCALSARPPTKSTSDTKSYKRKAREKPTFRTSPFSFSSSTNMPNFNKAQRKREI